MYPYSFIIALFSLLSGGGCLKGISLEIEPPEVERGGKATLLCNYQLEGAHLYAVKWYRGQREFYRYSPNENPVTKIFPFEGIHVDLSMSNATQVVVDQVGFNLSGNISCEVTIEAQFSTVTVSRLLTVIELPKKGPLIQTEKERYDVGDVLRANCTTAPSRPSAQIDFYISNLPVKGGDLSTRDAGNGLWTSRRTLEVKLDPSQFRGVPIVVKCEAKVGSDVRFAKLSVGAKTTEPVPERVTSPSQSPRVVPCYYMLLLIPFLTR